MVYFNLKKFMLKVLFWIFIGPYYLVFKLFTLPISLILKLFVLYRHNKPSFGRLFSKLSKNVGVSDNNVASNSEHKKETDSAKPI